MEIQDYIENKLFHEIHVSEIREFKKCRRAHNLKYKEQWYPKITREPLDFGTAIHSAKEIYFDPKRWVYDRAVSIELAKAAFVEENEKARQQTKDTLGSQYSDKEDANFDKRHSLGLGMLTHYFTVISPRIDANIYPTHVEQSFAVFIHDRDGNTLWCKCDKCWDKFRKSPLHVEWTDNNRPIWKGLPVALEGKIDVIFRDVKTQKYWLLDWKTTARLSQNYNWLDLDEQLNNYVWAMRELGIPVAGFVYHEDWKAYPQEPTRLSRPYKGRNYSTDKTQPTTYELFLNCIMEEDRQAYDNGAYDEYLSWLKMEGPQFFNRETIRKTNTELNIIGDQLFDVAREIISSPATYISPTKFGCQYCDFINVCIGMQQDSDWKYTLNSFFEQKEPYYADKSYDDGVG